MIRAVGPAPMGGEFVEIVIDEAAVAPCDVALFPQRAADLAADLGDQRGAGLSRAALSVRAPDAPHHRQHDGVPRRPGKCRRASSPPAARRDEIGIAERELAAMQSELASMLQQKTRLAALGLAVVEDQSRFAQPARPRRSCSPTGWSKLPDPQVQRFAPKLMQRARARHRLLPIDPVLWPRSRSRRRTAAPSRSGDLVDEVRETARPRPRYADRMDQARWSAASIVDADREQLLRVLLNLARNARAGAGDAGRPTTRPATRSAFPGGARGQSPSSRCPIPVRASRSGRGRICSRRSRARPAPAAPASASPSPPSWCAPMAARSTWWREPSAPPSASGSRTGRSS